MRTTDLRATIGNFCAGLLISITVASATAENFQDRPWTHDVMYFALTDRFFDGDSANDVPGGSDPALYDRTQQDIGKYHGGDLRGLEIALDRGYFRDLGVTALWISPPVRNVWNSKHDLGGAKTGYHGYWAQDFLDIDPHLTSRRSLDGAREYADTRDGRMQHYKDFVALAHKQGIKIVQDIVCNHTGPTFFYDANGNGTFDTDDKSEWIQPFLRGGFHDNAKWAENPAWNQVRTGPDGPQTILGRDVKTTGVLAKLETYGRKGFSDDSLGKNDGEEVECDFFSLRDLWTAPGSPHFDALVDEFVEIYAFYLEEIGVDGLRIDTIKHVHHAFWDAFTARLRAHVGPERAKRLLLFGEIYDGDAAKVGAYTYRADGGSAACLDTVLDFPFCFGVREYLRPIIGPFGAARGVEKSINALTAKSGGRMNFNPEPGPDGYNSRQKVVNFVENHDGLNRFRVAGISEKQNLLAQGLTLTTQGIPCLYYGTELGAQDAKGKVGRDGETGRLTLVPAGNPRTLDAIRKTGSFQAVAALAALRHQLPALNDGSLNPLWTDSLDSDADDGVFAFARYIGGSDDEVPAEVAIVVVNASERPRSTSARQNRMKIVRRSGKPLLREGDRLVRMPIAGLDAAGTREQTVEVPWKNGTPEVELVLAPQTVNIYRVQRAAR